MNSMKRVGLATGTLTDDEIEYLESAVVSTMRPMLVGRTLMPIKALSNAGFKQYTHYTEQDMGQAVISMTGEEQNMDRVELEEVNTDIPIISKDYNLHWRDVLMRRNTGQDLNVQHATNAARQVAEEEDKLILSGEYTGWPALGIEGIMTRTGRNTTAGGDWSANMVTYVAAAKAELRTDGYYGPYKLIVTSAWYAQMEAVYGNTDRYYFQVVGDLIGGVENIVISDNLYASDGGVDRVALIDTSPGNMELIVGQDTTTYLDQLPNMNYQGKVWEAVVPVIKRPECICTITALT